MGNYSTRPQQTEAMESSSTNEANEPGMLATNCLGDNALPALGLGIRAANPYNGSEQEEGQHGCFLR
jgi:hypothetical protein